MAYAIPEAALDEDFNLAIRRFGAHLRSPRSIVVVSAEWESMRPVRVTSVQEPSPAGGDASPTGRGTRSHRCPGSPALAAEIVERLSAAGVPAVLDMAHGLDEGAWIPVSLLFPIPRAPVVQVAIPAPVVPEAVRAMGAALGPLRYDGVMLLGTGSVVHNPNRTLLERRGVPPEGWAIAFDQWVRDRLDPLDEPALLGYRAQAPHAHLAAPTAEYIAPMFFVLGAREPGDHVRHLAEGFHGGVLSLRSFALSGRRAEDRRLPDALIAPSRSHPAGG